MKNKLWPNCALFCAAAFCAAPALAQSLPAPPAIASDPSANVPPVAYQSVFEDSPKGVERQTIDWKKANADVGQFRRGHIDLLKWEEANPPGNAPPKPNMPGNTQAAPAPATSAAGARTGSGTGTTPHKH